MRYGASFLAYAIWVHKNATPKNWLMRVKGLIVQQGTVGHRMLSNETHAMWIIKKKYVSEYL